MALVIKDRVRQATTSTGTGTITLSGTATGFQTFAEIGDGNTTYYTIVDSTAGDWEVGIGTYTAAGTTLSRDTVLASSNGNALVNFGAGTKDVWGDYPAGKAVTTDTLAYPPAIGGTTPNAATFTTLTATGQTSLGGNINLTQNTTTVNTPSGTILSLVDGGLSPNSGAYLQLGNSATSAATQRAAGANTNISIYWLSKGTGFHSFNTNNATGTQQFVVSHTASAVNYVQVTGAATGVGPTISVQGSDSNAGLAIRGKGSGFISLGQDSTTQFAVSRTASAVNYYLASGGSAGNDPTLTATGSDTNISMAFLSKGTGAIDLAAGSQGVNISNGGTVTGTTRTAAGSGYTSPPTITISPPTTAGGVQATATANLEQTSATGIIASGGTGYTVGDTITVSGGTATTAASYTVATVSAGVITSITLNQYGSYSAIPSNPVSVTGGTGTGATLNVVWQYKFATITNAGSGYVEQPTVTFSGGGGSGAAAFATIGSATSLKSLNDMTVNLPSGPVLSMTDSSLPSGSGAYLNLSNGSSSNAIQRAAGTATNIGIFWLSKGTSGHSFGTNNSTAAEQLRVAHTASAVNYVQVTGAATGSGPIISAQGSDTNAGLVVRSKGTGVLFLETQTGSDVRVQPRGVRSFSVNGVTGGVNYGYVTGSVAGSAPIFGSEGSDTNIDLALTTKGTGALTVNTGNGPQFKVNNTYGAGGFAVNYFSVYGRQTGSAPIFAAEGSDASISPIFAAKAGNFLFRTNDITSGNQLVITHTASAVNYVQITGSVTGAAPNISAQGSDTNVDLAFISRGIGATLFYGGGGTYLTHEIYGQAASANRFRTTATATGIGPLFSAVGGDANIPIRMRTQGTGGYQFETGSSGNEQFRISNTASAVNYVQVTGSATLTGAPTLSAQGSDFNIPLRLQSKGIAGVELGNPAGWAGLTVTTTNNPNRIALNAPGTGLVPTFTTAGVDTNAGMAFISKGTGAINLAPGSSGVNISNGGTVTAITRTNAGSGYTSIPALTISAPTTAGGVQATATPIMQAATATIVSGGTGYTAGDTLTVVGGTFTSSIVITVSTVSAGVITAVTINSGNFGNYSALPTSPVSVTGGTGTGATFNLTWSITANFTITNAGSGYVEQPTVTFSGGGGSGAAAYATVGSGTTVRSLGSTMSFATPQGEIFRVSDNGASVINYLSVIGTGGGAELRTAGAAANTTMGFVNKGTGNFYFSTNNSSSNTQFNVAHTASAVNYVQVTGAATTGAPAISVQGSDTNIGLNISSKGTSAVNFFTGSASRAFAVFGGTGVVNAITVAGSSAGTAPTIGVNGSDTNIDLALTPKGTGLVRFGTYTAVGSSTFSIDGYIEVKDSSGTTRKLAIIV